MRKYERIDLAYMLRTMGGTYDTCLQRCNHYHHHIYTIKSRGMLIRGTSAATLCSIFKQNNFPTLNKKFWDLQSEQQESLSSSYFFFFFVPTFKCQTYKRISD